MSVQYQIEGNLFQEIRSNWLCAYVRDFLIKARQIDVDEAGNTVEYFQLNDGRVFTRLVSTPQVITPRMIFNPRIRNTQPSSREHTVAHSR